MILKTGAEFATAVIDLATGLILLALTAAGLYGKDWREKKLGKSWLCVLIMLSFGNILGFAAHAFRWTETVFDVIWIFIYPFMYGVAVSFAVHALIYVTKGRLPGAGLKTAMYLSSAILCIVSTVTGFFTVGDIRIFVVYAALIDLPSLVAVCACGIKRRWKSGYFVLLALVPQLVGLPFQLLRKGSVRLIVELDHNGIYHLCLLVSVILFFFAARADIKTSFEETSVN